MKKLNSHPNSKKVTIYRSGTFISRAQGSEADEYFAQSKMGIGSYWDSINSQKIGTGLNFKEEELLLPNIIDTPADDKEFRKKVTEFYKEIYTNVTWNTGVTLEIGLLSDNKKDVSKDNMPIEIMDYIRYRHAINHPQVAASKEEANGNQMISFYIFDKEALQSKNTDKIKQRDKALTEYLKIKEEADQVDQMLTLMGIDPRDFPDNDNGKALKVEKLRELAESKPKEFVEAFEQGDLEIRAWIQTMVNVGVLKKVGERYIDVEKGEPIANELDELILYFKDDERSGEITVLKARMQEGLKKPIVQNKRKTQVS